ncbi:hypothetical protein Tco_1091172 [Tanacetum coccineum]|uniref:Uncharacterized protein n=1 Tax=Tanacetum coccineum TaxID=301880 RepID=A0ABQ5I7H6_9ASTR
MSGSDADAPPPPPPLPQSQTLVVAQAPHTMSTIKLLFSREGNGPVNVSTDTHGIMKVLLPKTAKETLARERERKSRTTLLLALPEDHLSQTSESEIQTSDFDTCESNCSDETHESLPEPAVNEPKVVSKPKVWNDAPIIEEYESDSEDEHVSLPSKEQETPSFANTIEHIKTPRQIVKQQNTCNNSLQSDEDSFELIELMILCTIFLTMGRIDDADAEDHVPVYIPEPEHPEDLVPAEDEAPTPLLPPTPFYLHGTRIHCYYTLPAPSTSRKADIPEADTPPRKRLLLTTPRPGSEVGESSAAANNSRTH